MRKHKTTPVRPDHRDPRWVAFGQRLTRLRQAKGWLAMDVARNIDKDPATISQLENGKRATGPERETLERLARLFDMSIPELLGEAGPPIAESHATDDPRTVFRPAPGDPRALVAGTPTELYAAVHAAIYAVFQDLTAALGERLNRAAPDLGRQTVYTGTDAPGGRGRG